MSFFLITSLLIWRCWIWICWYCQITFLTRILKFKRVAKRSLCHPETNKQIIRIYWRKTGFSHSSSSLHHFLNFFGIDRAYWFLQSDVWWNFDDTFQNEKIQRSFSKSLQIIHFKFFNLIFVKLIDNSSFITKMLEQNF